MSNTVIITTPTSRPRAASDSPARAGRSRPVVRHDLSPRPDRSRWIEAAYLGEAAAALDRQVRASGRR